MIFFSNSAFCDASRKKQSREKCAFACYLSDELLLGARHPMHGRSDTKFCPPSPAARIRLIQKLCKNSRMK